MQLYDNIEDTLGSLELLPKVLGMYNLIFVTLLLFNDKLLPYLIHYHTFRA